MSHVTKAGVVGTLLLAIMINATASRAAALGGPNDPPPARGLAVMPAATQANAARLTALISPFQVGLLIRGKNVLSITRPGVGEYCVKPDPKANIDVAKITPTVSVDWSTSGGAGNLVQYRSHGDGCPSGTISFATLGQDTSGQFVFSDSIGFVVVVP